jgi:hypothetical protein
MFSAFVLAFVLFFVFLLLVPIDIEGSVTLGDRPKVRVQWLFGLIGKDLFEETGAGKEPSSEEREELGRREAQKQPAGTPKKERESKGQGWSSREILSIIRTRGLIGNLKRFLKGLAGAIRVKRFRMRLRMGLEDPADTGQAAGYLWSMIGCLESLYPLDVRIEPSFHEEALEGVVEGALRIWPALGVLPLLRFSLSRPMLRAGRQAIRIMRKKNG